MILELLNDILLEKKKTLEVLSGGEALFSCYHTPVPPSFSPRVIKKNFAFLLLTLRNIQPKVIYSSFAFYPPDL